MDSGSGGGGNNNPRRQTQSYVSSEPFERALGLPVHCPKYLLSGSNDGLHQNSGYLLTYPVIAYTSQITIVSSLCYDIKLVTLNVLALRQGCLLKCWLITEETR